MFIPARALLILFTLSIALILLFGLPLSQW